MRPTKQVWLGIAFAVALAFALRWPQLSDSLWLDELHTSWCVSGTWGEIAERAQIGNHSPLYFFLPRMSAAIFGRSEIALRLPSLIAGLALVGLVGAIVWYSTKSAAASVGGALLIAIDPTCIFYSQEARPYALLQLLAWGHVAVVAALSHRSSGLRRLLFVAGCVLLIYVHYTSVLFVFAEAIFLFAFTLRRSDESAYSWRQFAIDVLIVAICSVPAITHVRAIMQHGSAWKSFIPQLTVTGFFQQTQVYIYLLWPTVAIWVAKFCPGPKGDKKPDGDRLTLLLVATVFVIPLAIAAGATQLDWAQLFFRRYLLPTYVAGIVLAPLLASTLCCIWFRSAVLALTLAMSLANSGIVQRVVTERKVLNDRQQDWRSAVQFINEHAPGNSDVAFVRGGFLEADQLLQPHDALLEQYNLAPVNNIYRLNVRAISMPTSASLWRRFLDTKFDRAMSRGQWFVFNGNAARRAEFMTVVRQELGEQLRDSRFDFERAFGDLLVFRVSKSQEVP